MTVFLLTCGVLLAIPILLNAIDAHNRRPYNPIKLINGRRHCRVCRRALPNDESCRACGPIQFAEREAAERAEAERRTALERKRQQAERLRTLEGLLALEPFEFESKVADLFRCMGYTVNQTRRTNDGGYDAVAEKDGTRFLIECKRYGRKHSVGRRDIQILHSAAVDQKAKATFVTTSSFATTAWQYAQNKDIVLITGEGLITLMRQYADRSCQR